MGGNALMPGAALSMLLGDMPTHAFFETYFGRKPLLIRGAMRVHPIFGWPQLNHLLNQHRDIPAGLKILKDGKETTAIDYLVVLRDLRQGYSLFFEDVDRHDAILADFLTVLSTELRCPTRFNLYLSFPGQQGRKLHFDTHDVFIVQVEGQKKWTLYDVTDQNPIYARINHEAPAPDNESNASEYILDKDDVLYVPRGYWHNVSPTDVTSLHLTLGIFIPNGVEFLYWLVDECTELPLARSNVPLPQQYGDQVSYKAARVKFFDEMIQCLCERARSKELFEEYEAFSHAALVNRMPFNLPYTTGRAEFLPNDDDALVALKHSIRITIRDVGSGLEAILIFSKRLLKFPSETYNLLSSIFDGQPFSTSTLVARFPSLEKILIVQTIRTLLGEGLIKLDQSPGPGNP